MRPDEARKLVTGDRVTWCNDQNDRGTVVKTAYNYIEIDWEREVCSSALHPNDCEKLGRVAS